VHVRRMVDASDVLGRVIERLQELGTLDGGNSGGFTRFRGMIQRMKAWYEAHKINYGLGHGVPSMEELNMGQNEGMMAVGGGDMGFNVRNLPDEEFWSAIMNCSFDGALMDA
jgi:hypothetical protein